MREPDHATPTSSATSIPPIRRGVFDAELLPAYRVEAVDTVGAVNTPVGAFVAALAEDHGDPVGCAQAAAALQIQRRGAMAVPTRAEMDHFQAVG